MLDLVTTYHSLGFKSSLNVISRMHGLFTMLICSQLHWHNPLFPLRVEKDNKHHNEHSCNTVYMGIDAIRSTTGGEDSCITRVHMQYRYYHIVLYIIHWRTCEVKFIPQPLLWCIILKRTLLYHDLHLNYWRNHTKGLI